MDKQDQLMRSYSRLEGLQHGINDVIDEHFGGTYIGDYHAALDHLKSIGLDTEEFRFPNATGRVERGVLQMRVATVMRYFTFKTGYGQPPTVGFER